MPTSLSVVAYVHAEPQGSAKAFVIGGKARITTDNSKLKPFRSEVTRCAMVAVRDANLELPMAGKHIPVRVMINFFLARGGSIPKKRVWPCVKPDTDKLIRAVLDSLTGVAFLDDGQVVEVCARKQYGSPERVEIKISVVE